MLLKFNEPVQQIAIQIAVLIANISRHDGPQDWQELVPTLVKAVQSTDSLVQYRGLLVLLHVVKVLYTKRLQRDRQQFEMLTRTLYEFVLNLWDGFTQLFFTNICEQNCALDVCATNLEKATISLRILKKLTILGFTAPHQSESCMMLLRVAFQRLKDLLECRLRVKRLLQQGGSERDLTLKVEKFIVKHMKFLNLFYEQHPAGFVEFVPTAFDFCFNYVFHEGTNMIFEDNVITFPNFAIQCLSLLKGILSQNTVYMEQAKGKHCAER